MKLRNSDITIGQQESMMQSLFPQFTYKRRKKRGKQCPTWIGLIRPTDKSPEYKVKFEYPYPSPPKVWIISPTINANAPHRYSDKSLCLYYPKDRSWSSKMYVAETIVPWTVEWLALYEIWNVTGEWFGEEALHTGKK